MTKNNFIFIEQICYYLNLLADDMIFTIKLERIPDMPDELKVTITCKNPVYCKELYLLTMLLDSMTEVRDDKETSVTIS